MKRTLKDKVVLLTGASRGIGLRTAERLVAKGAHLALVARTASTLAQLEANLKAKGGDVKSFPADLTKQDERARVVAEVAKHFGGIDILINGAGVAAYGPFATGKEETLRTITELNFFAAVELCRLCHPYLNKSALAGRRPAILNLTSIVGRVAAPGVSEHSASKYALVGFTEALRGEFARFDIDVLMIHPGLVKSDSLENHLLRDERMIETDFSKAITPDEVADAMIVALEKGKRESTVGRMAWWACLGKRMGPRYIRVVMDRKVKKYAQSQGR